MRRRFKKNTKRIFYFENKKGLVQEFQDLGLEDREIDALYNKAKAARAKISAKNEKAEFHWSDLLGLFVFPSRQGELRPMTKILTDLAVVKECIHSI